MTRLLAVRIVIVRLLAVELQNSCGGDKMTESVVVLQECLGDAGTAMLTQRRGDNMRRCCVVMIQPVTGYCWQGAVGTLLFTYCGKGWVL